MGSGVRASASARCPLRLIGRAPVPRSQLVVGQLAQPDLLAAKATCRALREAARNAAVDARVSLLSEQDEAAGDAGEARLQAAAALATGEVFQYKSLTLTVKSADIWRVSREPAAYRHSAALHRAALQQPPGYPTIAPPSHRRVRPTLAGAAAATLLAAPRCRSAWRRRASRWTRARCARPATRCPRACRWPPATWPTSSATCAWSCRWRSGCGPRGGWALVCGWRGVAALCAEGWWAGSVGLCGRKRTAHARCIARLSDRRAAFAYCAGTRPC